ncbi:TolB family protein [Paenibacillus planticolens]|uniref:Translocation protein TolB n=1 Tax=Paenibacillus planticolens TaxID=2654976 RepID=A0ABX1ZQC9_9BACL|nr:translocation protein TolB [Paenibacillus planticolens]NOV01068.1 translocation protein TolB [Paenibacillus planticolens]
MKIKMLVTSIVMSFLLSNTGFAEPRSSLQAAFVRGDNLWLKKDGQEMRLTESKKVSSPKWSSDGKFIAYSLGEGQHEIWVYSLETKQHYLVYPGGDRFWWSPTKNYLAFKLDGVLNTAKVDRDKVEPFKNVALGVDNYSWLPDGSGFLVSSPAQLRPSGWTNVELYTVPADANMDRSKIKPFYTLPSESSRFFAVGTSLFKWSNDKKWISFTANPTASLSADGNVLCVLSSDGNHFQQLDNMLHYPQWFGWAPVKSRLAYIEGEGRMAVQNKHLKLKDLPAMKPASYTPQGYADRDFTWENDRMIIVSRSKELSGDTVWPLPALFQVSISNKEQKQLTNPPEKNGDFGPYMLRKNNRLTWIRSDGKHADVWSSNPDGSYAEIGIKDLDIGIPYYGWSDWSTVLAWYDPRR